MKRKHATTIYLTDIMLKKIREIQNESITAESKNNIILNCIVSGLKNFYKIEI